MGNGTLKPLDMWRQMRKIEPKYTMEDYKAMYEVLCDFAVTELINNQIVKLPYLGVLKSNRRKGMVRHIPIGTETSEFTEKWVEPHFSITFKPSEVLKQNLNNDRPTRLQLKRRVARFRNELEKEMTEEEMKAYVLQNKELIKKASEERKMRHKRKTLQNADVDIDDEEDIDDSEFYEEFGSLEI